jgi:hypothetical protein
MGSQVTPKPAITPVVSGSGCVGHLRPTCRGYQAFDRDDRLLGVFIRMDEAAAAILTAVSEVLAA